VIGARSWWLGRGLWAPSGGLLLGVLGAEAGARDLDEVGTVGEAVEGRGGEEGLAEEVRPLSPVTVRGDSVESLVKALLFGEAG
jgi:hypothetical protein